MVLAHPLRRPGHGRRVLGRAGLLGSGGTGAAGEGDAVKPLSLLALIIGGVIGWYAAG